MLKYVDKAKDLYYIKRAINIEEFVSYIWEGIKKNAHNKYVVEKATKAFLELFGEGNRSPVRGKDILRRAGLAKYQNPNSHGLWPWLKKNDNADVIKQGKDEFGETVYSVSDDFYDTLLKIV